MKNKKLLKHIGIIMIPLCILVGMTILPTLTLIFGQEIALETIPVDPRDLFRGDYVSLNYKVSRIDPPLFSDKLDFGSSWEEEQEALNKDIYVVLKKVDDYHDIDFITLEKPDTQQPFLKGKIQYINRNYDTNKIDHIFMDYRLDKYFVPENTGMALEEASRKGELVAKIKVFHGYPILTDIEIK